MTASKRASNDQLDELHSLQATLLLDELRAYKAGERGKLDNDGAFHADPIPPALIAQINKFLKDNGVDRAITPGDPTSLLSEDCPEFADNVYNFGAK